MVHDNDYLCHNRTCPAAFLLHTVQRESRHGCQGQRECQNQRPMDGILPQQTSENYCILLHYCILHDVNRQCSRCIFCKLQPAWYLRAIVRIHGLGFCSFIYFHAPCPNYKESCRKEEHVLHFLGSGNFWNGILICGF